MSVEEEALISGSALVVGGMSASWIMDSGATSHMCQCRDLFVTYEKSEKPEIVTLGDRRSFKAVGRGTFTLEMKLPGGETKWRRLLETLHVLQNCRSIWSVCPKCLRKAELFGLSKQVARLHDQVLATATKSGSLYLLDCRTDEQINVAKYRWMCGIDGMDT